MVRISNPNPDDANNMTPADLGHLVPYMALPAGRLASGATTSWWVFSVELERRPAAR